MRGIPGYRMRGKSGESQKSADAKTPRSYDTTLPLPNPVPMDAFFKEKIPLLYVFKQCVLLHAARFRTSAGVPTEGFVAAECGVYKGHSLIACARIARELGVAAKFLGFDTFEGLPTLSETDRALSPNNAPYKDRLLFADAPLEDVQARCAAEGVADSIELIKGVFGDTLKHLTEQSYDFVNIDCDLYEGHMQCLEYFYPRMNPGGTIFFDDYHSVTFPMARKAVDNFLQGRSEQLFHVRFGGDEVNHTKAFLIKSSTL